MEGKCGKYTWKLNLSKAIVAQKRQCHEVFESLVVAMLARYVQPKITGACHSQVLNVKTEHWLFTEAKGRVLLFAGEKHQQVTQGDSSAVVSQSRTLCVG